MASLTFEPEGTASARVITESQTADTSLQFLHEEVVETMRRAMAVPRPACHDCHVALSPGQPQYGAFGNAEKVCAVCWTRRCNGIEGAP